MFSSLLSDRWHLASLALLGVLLGGVASVGQNAETAGAGDERHAPTPGSLFARTNLMAWCIVPFDARKRGPEERAEMLQRLGFKHFAYDWRDEHVPTFDEEIQAMQRRGISIDAWWFPANLGETSHRILETLKRHGVKAQLWVTMGDPAPQSQDQAEKVRAAVAILRPLAVAAAEIGCSIGLYNHGNWFGEPENQVQIIEELRLSNVGIVYNFHHGHHQISRFSQLFRLMQPHLLAVNLNGMIVNGDKLGKKILTIGQGDQELEMLRVIQHSGWKGLIGIIDHRDETDSELTLRENLSGLDKMLEDPPKPKAEAPKPDSIEDAAERAKLPEYQIEPAAAPHERTPANGYPKPSTFLTWERSHGDNTSSRFSLLNQVNRTTVKQLEVAWTYHSGDGSGNIQCNPVIVGDRLFTPTPGGYLVALNAATGKEIWRFKPELSSRRAGLADAPARRGLVYWAGDSVASPRLLFTASRWIYAVHPADGSPVREFGEDGRAVLECAGTVAGAVFKHVFIVPGFERDVFGFDVRTGKQLWRFHTIPKAGEFGAETWDSPEQGANCWGGMSLDEQRGVAYVTTGSPKPDFLGMGHRGQNLFANCVIALDALTGARLWHFQEVRHDIWDWDLPAAPVLVTVNGGGKKIDAVAAVTKLGNTLLLDRLTGKPLFPFRLRRAPTSRLPGEMTWPYQPDPEIPEPLVRQHFRLEDVTQRSEEATDAVMRIVSRSNYGWFEAFEEAKPTILFNEHGGAEWTGAASDPRTGRIYVSLNEIPWHITVFRDDEEPRRPDQTPTAGEVVYQTNCAQCHGPDRRGMTQAPPLVGLRHRKSEKEVLMLLETGKGAMPSHPYLATEQKQVLLDFLFLRDLADSAGRIQQARWTFGGWQKLLDNEGYPGCTPPWGSLACLDLNSGRIIWKVPLGEYEELTRQGFRKTGTENFGGASVTAGGLVFVSGTRDNKIRAFDAETGQELWSYKLPFHGTAPPAIYSVQERQFVFLPATGGGKLGGPVGDTFVAFALPLMGQAQSVALQNQEE